MVYMLVTGVVDVAFLRCIARRWCRTVRVCIPQSIGLARAGGLQVLDEILFRHLYREFNMCFWSISFTGISLGSAREEWGQLTVGSATEGGKVTGYVKWVRHSCGYGVCDLRVWWGILNNILLASTCGSVLVSLPDIYSISYCH